MTLKIAIEDILSSVGISSFKFDSAHFNKYPFSLIQLHKAGGNRFASEAAVFEGLRVVAQSNLKLTTLKTVCEKTLIWRDPAFVAACIGAAVKAGHLKPLNLYVVGLALRRLGHDDAAAKMLRLASIDHLHAPSQLELAIIKIQSGDFEQASKVLDECVRASDQNQLKLAVPFVELTRAARSANGYSLNSAEFAFDTSTRLGKEFAKCLAIAERHPGGDSAAIKAVRERYWKEERPAHELCM
jgi:hypothetical protein